MMNDDEMESILNILYRKPSIDELQEVLEKISEIQERQKDLNYEKAKITGILTNEILPEYFPLIFSKKKSLVVEKLKRYLCKCLSDVAGIKAILLRVKKIATGNENAIFFQHIFELLEILQEILSNEGNLISTWIRYHPKMDEKQDTKSPLSLVWDEYVSLIAGGRLLGIASEGLHKSWQYCEVNQRPVFWVADGLKYVEHLGNEIVVSLNDVRFNEKMEYDFSRLVGRLFSLGYTAQIVSSFFPSKVVTHNYLSCLHRIMRLLTFSQKTVYIHFLLSFFDKKYFQNEENLDEKSDICHKLFVHEIGIVSAIIKDLLIMDNDMFIIIDNWLLNYNFKTRIYTRRAVVSSYYSYVHDMKIDENMLERLCLKWSSKFFIKHAPIIEQEVLTQTVLLSAAFVSRNILEKLSHFKAYLDGLTDRLSSSSERVRFLGMILGESLTRKLFANDEKKWLTFNVKDTLTIESNWWRNIININDFSNMTTCSLVTVNNQHDSSLNQDTIKQNEQIQLMQENSNIIVSDEDDLVPYSLPDSDDEDSDDDPAFIEKNKRINAPVYIRELISMLKDNTSYPKLHIALKTSPDLIRRKANFGTELTKEAVTLARIISSMNDEFNMDKFIELKQESMIALVATCPELVAPYFIEEYFTGDISIQQRYMILSALVLGAREISGIDPSKNKMFPSKILNPKLHQQYITPIDIITEEMSILAVKQNTSDFVKTDFSKQQQQHLNVLKERRFSKKTEIMKNKSLPKANPLASIAGKYFIFPMIGYWWTYARDMYNNKTHYEPLLLSQFLKSIAIIFQASYPSVSQYEISKEIWEFIFFFRNQTDSLIINSILFLILTLLDLINDHFMFENHIHYLLRSREWASVIFKNILDDELKLLSSYIIIRITTLFDKLSNNIKEFKEWI
ncbi:hypothetical protein PCK1_000173 [Pneumocystis canis]|nr:hypothetical protein PCK1_000173 [Pneumocystis canis]